MSRQWIADRLRIGSPSCGQKKTVTIRAADQWRAAQELLTADIQMRRKRLPLAHAFRKVNLFRNSRLVFGHSALLNEPHETQYN
jgi:hypothetical protein